MAVPILYAGVAYSEMILTLAGGAVIGLTVSATDLYHEVVVEKPLHNEIAHLKQDIRAQGRGFKKYRTKSGNYVYVKGSPKDIQHLMMKDKWGTMYMIGK